MTRLWLSPEEAAPVLGMKPAKIRNYMRRGILDLGLAIPPEKTGKTMWEFRIYPAKIEKIIGEKLERPEKEMSVPIEKLLEESEKEEKEDE